MSPTKSGQLQCIERLSPLSRSPSRFTPSSARAPMRTSPVRRHVPLTPEDSPPMGDACVPLEPSVVAFLPPAPVQVAQTICGRDAQKEWDAMMLRRLEGGAAASLDVVKCLRHNARAFQPAGTRVSMRRTSLSVVVKYVQTFNHLLQTAVAAIALFDAVAASYDRALQEEALFIAACYAVSQKLFETRFASHDQLAREFKLRDHFATDQERLDLSEDAFRTRIAERLLTAEAIIVLCTKGAVNAPTVLDMLVAMLPLFDVPHHLRSSIVAACRTNALRAYDTRVLSSRSVAQVALACISSWFRARPSHAAVWETGAGRLRRAWEQELPSTGNILL